MRNRCRKVPQRFTGSNLVDLGRERRVPVAGVLVGELLRIVKPVTGRLLRSFCREHLAGFKCPRRFDFRAKLPRLESGKLARRQLQDSYGPG